MNIKNFKQHQKAYRKNSSFFFTFYSSFSVPQCCSQWPAPLWPFSAFSGSVCKGVHVCVILPNTNGRRPLGYHLSTFSCPRKLNITSHSFIYLPHSSQCVKRIHRCSVTCHPSTGGYLNYCWDFVTIKHSPVYILAQIFLNKGE